MQTIKEILKKPARYRTSHELAELIDTKSIEVLADIVPANETVLRIVKGVHNSLIGVLAATDKRLIFVSRGAVRKVEMDFKYLDIVAAMAKPKLFMSSVYVQHGEKVFVIDKITRKHAKRFAKFVDDKAREEQSSFMKGKKSKKL